VYQIKNFHIVLIGEVRISMEESRERWGCDRVDAFKHFGPLSIVYMANQ
jgi:hypothetical protein